MERLHLQKLHAKVSSSALARRLLEMWAWGSLTASSVQRLAASALQDGAVHADVRVLAKLGKSGELPNHCARDLMQLLKNNPLRDCVATFDATVKTSTLMTKAVKLPIMYPHQLFSCAYHAYPSKFREIFLGGDEANAQKFWNAMRAHPAAESHIVFKEPERQQRTIPFMLHGDGVASVGVSRAWQKSVEAFSMRSALAEGPVALMNFLIFFM